MNTGHTEWDQCEEWHCNLIEHYTFWGLINRSGNNSKVFDNLCSANNPCSNMEWLSDKATIGLEDETRTSEWDCLSTSQDRVKLPVFGEVNEFMNYECMFIWRAL